MCIWCLLCVCVLEDVNVRICCFFFFFQAEDGIRDLVRSRGLGDVYKRQALELLPSEARIGVMPVGNATVPRLEESAMN